MKKAVCRVAAWTICLALLLLCVGCGSSAVDDLVDTNATTAEDYRLEINEARLGKDSEGNDVIIVTYILTNISDETGSNFIMQTHHAAYQNGSQLEEVFLLEDITYNITEGQIKEVAIGETAVVEVAYKLLFPGVNVDVEFSSRSGGQQLTHSFLIA